MITIITERRRYNIDQPPPVTTADHYDTHLHYQYIISYQSPSQIPMAMDQFIQINTFNVFVSFMMVPFGTKFKFQMYRLKIISSDITSDLCDNSNLVRMKWKG